MKPQTDTTEQLGLAIDHDAEVMASRVLRLAQVHEKAVQRATDESTSPAAATPAPEAPIP